MPLIWIHFQECAHRFPVPLYGNDGRKMDKFVLTVPQDNLRCVVTLTGDSITHAVSVVHFNEKKSFNVHGSLFVGY